MDHITLDHGSGGEASNELVKNLFLKTFGNEFLARLDDSAVIPINNATLAMTTDSYVVDPIFFPGGDIGSLAIHGTVNDLSMQGATPLYLTVGLILEEGLSLDDLAQIANSISRATHEASVKVVAGDTKVVPKGHADKVFINTAGIGIIPQGVQVSATNARPGDVILINGTIGDHGMTILTNREGLEFETALKSDSAPLNGLVSSILATTTNIHVLRDPTRGGLASALNEIASASNVGIELEESAIPISDAVRSASEILGLDPLYVANEGKCLVFLPETEAHNVLDIMRGHKYGQKAAIIGRVTEQNPGKVLLKTDIGGTRIVSMPSGEQLPRIC